MLAFLACREGPQGRGPARARPTPRQRCPPIRQQKQANTPALLQMFHYTIRHIPEMRLSNQNKSISY